MIVRNDGSNSRRELFESTVFTISLGCDRCCAETFPRVCGLSGKPDKIIDWARLRESFHNRIP